MRGASQIDWDATVKRCFLDRRSIVFQDGREVLFGDDMSARRYEVHNSHDRKCVVCGKAQSFDQFHLHHKVYRSTARDDRADNLQVLCMRCHMKEHSQA